MLQSLVLIFRFGDSWLPCVTQNHGWCWGNFGKNCFQSSPIRRSYFWKPRTRQSWAIFDRESTQILCISGGCFYTKRWFWKRKTWGIPTMFRNCSGKSWQVSRALAIAKYTIKRSCVIRSLKTISYFIIDIFRSHWIFSWSFLDFSFVTRCFWLSLLYYYYFFEW